MKPYVLVVDDEPDIRALVKDILEDEGYEVSVAQDGASARRSAAERTPDLVLLDIWMPDMDGISLLKEFVDAKLGAPVVMISGHGTVESAVEATRQGAYDFIEKPLSMGKLLSTVQKALAAGPQHKELPRTTAARANYEPVGRSAALQRLRDQARRIAEFDTWLLISGEAGSGKEMFARYIHQNSPRKNAPFMVATVVAMNNGKTDELLFGREAGGEIQKGVLEDAHGGVLFIDDVADLDSISQAKLLDACATHTYKRMGGTRRVEIDVRVIAATRTYLPELVASGRMREDLFYRISEISLHLPPLRERVEDIPDLLTHFTDLFVHQEQLPYRKFSLAAQNWLRNYHWPGNVLELRNLAHRVLILGTTPEVNMHEMEAAMAEQTTALVAGQGTGVFNLPLRAARDHFEKSYLEYHLQQAGGNVGQVAKQAGMERTHLYRKIRSLGIDTKQIKEHKE